jgi:hypothetical protein
MTMLIAMARVQSSAAANTPDSRGVWRSPASIRAAEIPDWVRLLVRVMDGAIAIPGTKLRIGLDPIIGLLLPGIGDVLGALPSMLLVSIAARSGVPRVVIARMLLNVAIDSLVGAVPLVGDVFDATFHANEKNLELLERHAGEPRSSSIADYVVVALAVLFAVGCVLLPVILVVMLVKALVGH